MEMKPLGATSVMVPEIGLGTWRFRGNPEVVNKSLEMGGFLIDTAEAYGSEVDVGRAVRGRRDSFFIATKVSPQHLRYKDVLNAADASLRRLRTDHIDLYQVHWPNPSIHIQETMRAMGDLVSAGKVLHVGVSNFSAQELDESRRALSSYSIVSNQVRYNLFDREIEEELLPYCEAHQVTVIAYSPLAQGKLERKLSAQPRLVQVLDQIHAATAKTRAQILLAWCIQWSIVITIPKTDQVQRVEENCGASGWRLTPEQYAALKEAAR